MPSPTHNTVRVSLTAAQILSLNTNPVELISGSAGQILVVYSVYLRYFHGSTPFNPQSDDQFAFYTGNINSTYLIPYPGGQFAQGFIDQTQDMSQWYSPAMDGQTNVSANLTDIEGSGLYLTQFNYNDGFPTGTNWTEGNGTMLALIEYGFFTP